MAGEPGPRADLRYLKQPQTRTTADSATGRITSFLHTLYESVAETLPDECDDSIEYALHGSDSADDPYMHVSLPVADTADAMGPVQKLQKVKRYASGLEKKPEEDAKEIRHLPPGCMKDYWEQFHAHDNQGSVAFSTFWRVWRSEFGHLRFRRVSSHAQCSTCLHHRLLLRELSPYVVARKRQAQLYNLHLLSQYRDRQVYWSLRGSSRLRVFGHIVLIQDGMDQAKFMWPRGPALKAKDLSTLIRPRLSITGVLAHGWSLLLAVSTPETKKDSSSSAELFGHMLTRLQGLGVRLCDTVIHLFSDNTSRELKNSTTARLLTVLCQTGPLTEPRPK